MKVTEKATYCSSCFCQTEGATYVDFDAYWDGPVIDGKSHKQPIDDLVICDSCLKAAASLIGMVHNKSMRTENFELGRAVEEKDKYIKSLEKMIGDLDHSLGVAIQSNVKRPSGRPVQRAPGEAKEKLASANG